MGAGIAEAFATAGSDVVLYDLDSAALGRAQNAIERGLSRLVTSGRIPAEDATSIVDRVKLSSQLDPIADASLVVEAVIEDIDVKQDLFRRLESLVAPEAILTTNTSTLSITEIASVLSDAGRAAATHFFNPAARMKLVEMTPGLFTRNEVVATLQHWLSGIGKTGVIVQESPGGIVSRLQLLVRNEALRLVAEGVATPADIDIAMKLGSGWPMGPLELIDLVGIDVHVKNSESLARELGSNRYQPHPYLRRLVRGGRLGKKSGAGIFEYPAKPAGSPA